jgi:hypothetical protein
MTELEQALLASELERLVHTFYDDATSGPELDRIARRCEEIEAILAGGSRA